MRIYYQDEAIKTEAENYRISVEIEENKYGIPIASIKLHLLDETDETIEIRHLDTVSFDQGGIKHLVGELIEVEK